MIPLSCSNCWHNALQYGTIGLSVGYCTQHRKILNRAEETTCALHMRKDLPLASVRRESELHRKQFTNDVVLLRTKLPGNGAASEKERDIDLLREDEVGEAVTDYGQLGAQIESIAQLRKISGVRAELAMLSLSRAYVYQCVERKGSWTSGIHILWWTRQRIGDEPDVRVEDLRHSNSLPLTRKVELARWSIIMLRLTFIADVASHAAESEHPIARLSNIVDGAADAVNTFNTRRLLGWTKRVALKEINKVLPRSQYMELARELHRRDESAPWQLAPGLTQPS